MKTLSNTKAELKKSVASKNSVHIKNVQLLEIFNK